MTRRARTLAVATVGFVALGVVVGFPTRADAHGVGGVKPTNYETRVNPGSPGIPGVTVTPVDLGERVELTNRSSATVTVVGYQDEPYLRIGPDGTYENLRSPATFLNRTLVPTGTSPASADPGAPPEWRKISDEPVARWHDHRAHWMGPKPEIVRAAPDEPHTLTDWSIPLLVDGTPGAQVTGTIAWAPSTSPWPWLVGALGITAVIGIASRTRAWRPAWLIALAAIIVLEVVAVSGAWRFSTYGLSRRFFANAYNVGALAIAILAVWQVVRRKRDQVAPLVLIAGLVALFGTGLPGFADLGAPFVPTVYPPWVARVIVAVAIGAGLGLTIGAAQFLRIAGTRSRPASTTPPRKPIPEEEPCPSVEVSPPPPLA